MIWSSIISVVKKSNFGNFSVSRGSINVDSQQTCQPSRFSKNYIPKAGWLIVDHIVEWFESSTMTLICMFFYKNTNATSTAHEITCITYSNIGFSLHDVKSSLISTKSICDRKF